MGSDTSPSSHSALILVDWARRIAVFAYALMLVWAPLPLGSAVSWGPGLFEMGIAICCILWIMANLADPAVLMPAPRILIVPMVFFGLMLLWAFLQTQPLIPSWSNPLWAMAGSIIQRPLPGVISINPWRTQGEILKLASYGAAFWLALSTSRDRAFAAFLFYAVIAIGAFYALYAFILDLARISQAELIYHQTLPNPFLSGPFMLHNSFATYMGLATLAATSALFASALSRITLGKGLRRFTLSAIQYLFGQGAPLLVAALLLFAAVAGSASRGGFGAMTAGLLAMSLLSLFMARRSTNRPWAALAVLGACSPLALFVFLNNDSLSRRFAEVLDAGTADDVRVTLWHTAARMIESAPWQGLGLGTFQDAYPLYAGKVLPYLMDKAHCDYLEFAAGLGLPAAIAAWVAIAWLALFCLWGTFKRRRDKIYALTGFCATVLVAVHSGVDFSLQLPAVGLSYATLLGIGVAQSRRSGAA